MIALRHRNFRLLWWGQLISFSGSTMQTAAILWHVSMLVSTNHKALALGMVGLVRVVPIIAFSLLSGVIADAVDRRRLMLVTQTSMAALAAILSTLTFRGLSVVWPIYLLTFLSAAAGSFDSPARQALIPVLVPREHLANAISLNATMFQIASVMGPSLAGVRGVAGKSRSRPAAETYLVAGGLAFHAGMDACIAHERLLRNKWCTFPVGARRRAGICCFAAPVSGIACVAAPCICPPGARDEVHHLFRDRPLRRHCGLRIGPTLSG